MTSTKDGFIAYDDSGAVVGVGRSALEIIGRMYGDGWREAEVMTQKRLQGGGNHHTIHKATDWNIKVTAGMIRSVQKRNARKRA